jgi:FkbM family methyltransferase
MKTITRAIDWSFGKLGLQLRRRGADSNGSSGDRLIDYLRQLREFGFEPRTIYDIGANRGLWAAKALRVFPRADYVLFEPQRKLGEELGRLMEGRANVKWRQCAVSDAVGTAEFLEHNWDVCSHLSFEAEAAAEAGMTRVKVETTTVDEEMRRSGRGPELLKIDAEGHDLKVIDGAREALRRAEVVMVEGSVNCGGMDNTVQAVINRMAEEGFGLTGIVDLNEFHFPGRQWHGLLWLVDLAFCRKDGELIKKFEQPVADEMAAVKASVG